MYVLHCTDNVYCPLAEDEQRLLVHARWGLWYYQDACERDSCARCTKAPYLCKRRRLEEKGIVTVIFFLVAHSLKGFSKVSFIMAGIPPWTGCYTPGSQARELAA